jgi:hypothetical protein
MTTTKTVKAVNWTAETVEMITEKHLQGVEIETIATEAGKTVAAVRSKLVSLGVYQKQEAKAVGGASSVRKIQLVKQIAESLNQEIEAIESLEKASKEALLLVLEAVKSVNKKAE